MTQDPLPTTTIVVPTLNEAAHIRTLIAQLLPPESRSVFIRELVVADGGSIDGTVEIVGELAERDPRIRLIHNPGRIQSAGINAGVAAADPASRVILRADAHAEYPPDFAERVVRTLLWTGADSVVVRLRTTGRGCFQQAVAAATNSRAGSGGSAHRVGGVSGFIDHGHHSGFRRSVFDDLRGYDETFIANEDAELDARIRASGHRIWFENGIEIVYYPRRTPAALARQYWRYGQGRAQTYQRHGERLRLRQMAPPLLTLGLALSVPGGALTLYALLVPCLYLGLLCLVGGAMAWRSRQMCLLLTPVALAIIHIAWGGGFLFRLAGFSR